MQTHKVKYLILWGFLFYALVVFLPTFNASPIFHVYYMIMMYGLGVSFLLIASFYLRGWVRNAILMLALGGFLYLLFLMNLNSPYQYLLRVAGVSMGAIASAYVARYLLEEVRISGLDLLIYGVLIASAALTPELLISIEAITVMVMMLVAKSCKRTWLIKGIWWFIVPFSGALLGNILHYHGHIGSDVLLRILSLVALSYTTIAVYFLFTAIELYTGMKKVKKVLGQ